MWIQFRLFGRDDRTRTCGIVLPKHARYHLRYISIKIFSLHKQLFAALPVATKSLPSQQGLLVTRQVAATPYFSLHHPLGALETVPTCATPTRKARWIIRFSQSPFTRGLRSWKLINLDSIYNYEKHSQLFAALPWIIRFSQSLCAYLVLLETHYSLPMYYNREKMFCQYLIFHF